jgi:DNA modification methylase
MLRLKSRHRILCGDSTDENDVAKLMAGEKADMVFTDPPYGMNLDTDYVVSEKVKGNNYKEVIGDQSYFDPRYILEIFKEVNEVFIWGADYFHDSLPRSGSFVVWDKRNDELSEAIGNDFELCWSKRHHKRLVYRKLWSGFTAKEKNEKRVHPTQKPIQLAEWFFDKWGRDKNLIVDLFLGSGSTLIACEKTGRRLFGMELDEHYMSVIIKRFEEYSGETAVRL